MGTIELQKQIKLIVKQLKWKKSKFLSVLYTELYETDVEEEMRKFQERVKQHLRRKTTPPEKLQNYLNIISEHPDFKKSNLVHNTFKSAEVISTFMEKQMKGLSNKIDDSLE